MKNDRNMNTFLFTESELSESHCFEEISEITHNTVAVGKLTDTIDFKKINEYDLVVFDLSDDITKHNVDVVIANLLSTVVSRKDEKVLILNHMRSPGDDPDQDEVYLRMYHLTELIPNCVFGISVYAYLKSKYETIPHIFVGYFTDNPHWFANEVRNVKYYERRLPSVFRTPIDNHTTLPRLFDGLIKDSDSIADHALLNPEIASHFYKNGENLLSSERNKNQIGGFWIDKKDHYYIANVWIVPRCSSSNENIEFLNQFDEIYVDLSIEHSIGWVNDKPAGFHPEVKYFSTRDFDGTRAKTILLNMEELGLLDCYYEEDTGKFYISYKG